MAEVRTGATGAYPRSEALVQATRDLDRGRITPEDGEAAFRRDEAEVARIEEQLGFSARTHGNLRWADLFRPFTELWSGVRAGTLTRFFETNTFYRQPVIYERPRPTRGSLAPWIPSGPRARAVVPGPYTFARMSEVSFSGANGGSAPAVIADTLGESIAALGTAAPPEVVFHEPMLTYDLPASDRASVVAAYRALAERIPRLRRVVWTYYGDLAPLAPLLPELAVDGVGFDLVESTIPSDLQFPGTIVGVGCLDSRTTLIEDPSALAPLVSRALGARSIPEVWIGPSPPFDLLPLTSAVAKLRVLPKLQAELTK